LAWEVSKGPRPQAAATKKSVWALTLTWHIFREVFGSNLEQSRGHLGSYDVMSWNGSWPLLFRSFAVYSNWKSPDFIRRQVTNADDAASLLTQKPINRQLHSEQRERWEMKEKKSEPSLNKLYPCSSTGQMEFKAKFRSLNWTPVTSGSFYSGSAISPAILPYFFHSFFWIQSQATYITDTVALNNILLVIQPTG
jgi:hypothetical protein